MYLTFALKVTRVEPFEIQYVYLFSMFVYLQNIIVHKEKKLKKNTLHFFTEGELSKTLQQPLPSIMSFTVIDI